MPPRFVTIPFSHYCEKARWALDRARFAYEEEAHVPLVHYPFARRAGGARTVPVLKTPHGTLADSTDILRFVDRGLRAEDRLFPDDEPRAAEVVAWEEELDRRLGPAARVWAYFHVLPERATAERLLERGSPAWEGRLVKLAYPAAAAVMRRGMRIDAPHADKALARVRELFAKVGATLADGRRWLAGDRFTAADVAFASLSTPVLLPPEHAHRLGGIDDLPRSARPVIEELRATAAGRFALRLYADDRARTVG